MNDGDIRLQAAINAVMGPVYDEALPLWERRTLGAAVEWREIDALLEIVYQPVTRRQRCERCDGGGMIFNKILLRPVSCVQCGGTGYKCEAQCECGGPVHYQNVQSMAGLMCRKCGSQLVVVGQAGVERIHSLWKEGRRGTYNYKDLY